MKPEGSLSVHKIPSLDKILSYMNTNKNNLSLFTAGMGLKQ